MLELRRADGSVAELSFEEFEARVRAGTIPPEAMVRFQPVTGEQFREAASLELFSSVLDDPHTRFQRRYDLRRPPRVTLTLVVLLAAVFVWQTRQSPVLNAASLIGQGAKSMPHQLELGEWWRLASASMLHSGWLHLIPNLLFVLYVGWNVEAILGASGMTLLLVTAGIGSMGVSSYASEAATVGASGMTFAVFGAAIALGWRYGPWLPRRVRARYGWPMVPFVAYFLMVGMMWESIDNFCHVGGLVIGGALGLTVSSSLQERADQWPRKAGRVVAAALFLGFVTVVLPMAWRVGLLPGAQPRREPVVAGEAGWELRPPGGWEAVSRGGPGWQSPTGRAQLTARAWIEELEVPTAEAVRRRWVQELEESAVVVPRAGPAAEAMGLPPQWFTLESNVVAGDQVLMSLRVGVVRGLYVTTLEFLHPVDYYEDYDRVRRSVLETVRIREPRSVVRALEALHGGDLNDSAAVERALDAVPARVGASPAEALRLVAELARFGERDRSRFLLSALIASGATGPELQYWDLWIAHHLDGGAGPDGMELAHAVATRQPDSLPAAALCFDVMLAAGETEEARAVLERMKERWPERLPVIRRQARLPPPRPHE